MDKQQANRVLRTIGEVAEVLSIPAHVIRFWQSKFPQVKPMKQSTRRYFRPEDVELLLEIKCLLYKDGYTIKAVQKYLEDRDQMKKKSVTVENHEDVLVFEDHKTLTNPTNNEASTSENLTNEDTKEAIRKVLDRLHVLREKISLS